LNPGVDKERFEVFPVITQIDKNGFGVHGIPASLNVGGRKERVLIHPVLARDFLKRVEDSAFADKTRPQLRLRAGLLRREITDANSTLPGLR
jgi:hypothetical protein